MSKLLCAAILLAATLCEAAPAESRVIFLQRRGLAALVGKDDARVDRSSLVTRPTRFAPWEIDDATWHAVTACVTGLFERFDVEITDLDPGPTTPHVEAVFTHRPDASFDPGSQGIAPFAADCGVIENAIVLTFVDGLDPQQICEVQAQEIAHAFGVDHELLATDLMSYLPRPGPRAFQDEVAPCGEYTARPCGAGCGATQSSVRILAARLGVTAPLDGPVELADGCASSPQGAGSSPWLVALALLALLAFRRRGLVVLVAACTGSAPPDPTDARPEPVTARIAGHTIDLFSPGISVGGAAIAFDGTPVATASDAIGAFDVELPPGSVVYPISTHAGYRPTRNASVLALEGQALREVALVAEVQLRSMSLAASGTGLAPNTAAVFADLRRFGAPITGEALSAIRLVGSDGAPVPARGPFVVDARGQLDLAAATTAATFDGRAVVGWLDCPVGTWRIAIAGALLPQNVICDADGATLVDTTIEGEPTLPATPRFTTDIFPTLGRPSADPRGLACTACHDQLAAAQGLVPIAFDGLASGTHAAILARVATQPPGDQLVDLANPEQSLLLRRPLFEPPPAAQDHPNATLIDTRTFEYQLFLRWIQQGAAL